MTHVEILYRLCLHTRGTTDPSVDSDFATVEFTFDVTTDIAEMFSFGGVDVKPLEGESDDAGWECEFIDIDGAFTALLSDTGGRMVWLRRLSDVRESTDGGTTWSTLTIGRAHRISLTGNVATYTGVFRSEREIAKTSQIFTDIGSVLDSGDSDLYGCATLLPPGRTNRYRNAPTTFTRFQIRHTPQTSGDWVLIALDLPWITFAGTGITTPDALRARPEIADIIKDDVIEDWTLSFGRTSGNFRTLRCRVNGTDREVLGFVFEPDVGDYPGSTLDALIEGRADSKYIEVWVYWPTYSSDTITEAFLYMFGAEPTADMTKLIGGQTGIHPGELFEDIETEIGERFDSAAMAAWQADTLSGKVHFRITKPQNAHDWTRENLLRPYLRAALLNSYGEVTPVYLGLPQDLDPDTLFSFTPSNCTLPHPTWEHGVENLVTRIRGTYAVESPMPRSVEHLPHLEELIGDYGFDLLKSQERDVVKDHDRLGDFGVHEREVSLRGLHQRGFNLPLTRFFSSVDVRMQILSREWFHRFGDGAIWGMVFLRPDTASAPQVGDWAKIEWPSFPNPASQARGGTRIVQIVSRERIFHGGETAIAYGWLDGGPDAQPLATPTVSATTVDEHRIDVTISNLPTGAGYQLEAAESATEPSATSELWEAAAQGDGNETVRIGNLKSGTRHYFRARATAQHRIRSAWSATDFDTTTALSAPSNLTATPNGGTCDLGWTNGETDYPIEVLLDEAACASADPERIALLPPGSTVYEIVGLAVSTTHCARVRHRDVYGGVSPTAQAEFTTGSTLATPDAPLAITVVQGIAG